MKKKSGFYQKSKKLSALFLLLHLSLFINFVVFDSFKSRIQALLFLWLNKNELDKHDAFCVKLYKYIFMSVCRLGSCSQFFTLHML